MKRNDGRLAGILGTVIFHLLAAVIFMSFQVRSLQKENEKIFRIEFEESPEPESEEEKIEIPLSTLEKILQGDNEMLNIARNLANKADPTVNRDDYIDRVKEELIKSGQLDENNYIDEWREKALNGDENLAMEKEQPKTIEQEKPTASQEMASNFQGPTRIYYNLEGRTHTYLPIPIYKCEGAGKIMISIVVNLKGIVEDAKVNTGESTTTNPCLIETALQAALLSRFNADVDAPRTQKGTITYHFVAQ
jgi:hypothetical protein